MKVYREPIELPWAVPHKQGFKGEAPGLYFHYYRTRQEAVKCEGWLKRNGKYIGPAELRPGEARLIGHV